MAEKVAEKSNGKMQIEIYPSQQLGNEKQCLELLQIGSLAMTKVSAAVMENFNPNIEVFSLPYIFRDRQHYYRVLDGEIGQNLLEQGKNYWLRGLTYFDAGLRSFFSIDPITTPQDLTDKKNRVQESVTEMGMDPTHFVIIMVLNLCIGLCTPPGGSVLFVGVGGSGY